jgi:signal transduction histidine kinase
MSGRSVRREPPASSEEEAESEIKQWLARELHDRVASMLGTMLAQMEQLDRREDDCERRGKEAAGPLTDVREELESFQESTRRALGDLRRLVQELGDEPGAVTALVDSVRRLLDRCERRSGIRCRLTCDAEWPAVLDALATHNLFRIVEEAVRNVENHSAARSVDVSLEWKAGLATVTVQDDGAGIDTVPEHGGFGLAGMTERAVLVGGSLRLESEPGRGTTVRATFPVERLH